MGEGYSKADSLHRKSVSTGPRTPRSPTNTDGLVDYKRRERIQHILDAATDDQSKKAVRRALSLERSPTISPLPSPRSIDPSISKDYMAMRNLLRSSTNTQPNKKAIYYEIADGSTDNSSTTEAKAPISLGYHENSTSVIAASSDTSAPSTPPTQNNGSEPDIEDLILETLDKLERLPRDDRVTFVASLAESFPEQLRAVRLKIESLYDSSSITDEASTDDPWYWNSRFQPLIDKINTADTSEDRLETYAELSRLSNDFLQCATFYGQMIISEAALPPSKRTLQPLNAGGALGGLKYVTKSILFKFAINDSDLFDSDDIAAKVAGHDLKGLVRYSNVGIPGAYFPMMALIDYLGYRLQALSLLPISKQTIIYGSDDGGNTIHNDVPKFDEWMRLAAEKLNLKPHLVGLSGRDAKLLYSCGDIEGHQGFDGRFYLLDFSRSFPPFKVNRGVKRGHLFQLFRPEFVTKYKIPLCSDTYSGFVADNQKEHIKEVEEATEQLSKIITNLAGDLNSPNGRNLLREISLKTLLHKHGINLSFMGHLRHLVQSLTLKRIILIDMIARTAKHILNQLLREQMKKHRIGMQESFKVVVINFMNELFGESEEGTTFWNTTLKKEINHHFPDGLSSFELGATYNLRETICKITTRQGDLLPYLFNTFLKMTGIKMVHADAFQYNSSFQYKRPFDETDIELIGAKVKHTNIVATSMGFYLKQKGEFKLGEDSVRLLKMAVEKFKEALERNMNDKITLRELAHTYELLMDREAAAYNYKEALALDASDPETLQRYAEFLQNHAPNDAEENFLKSLELDPSNIRCLQGYSAFLYAQNRPEEAAKFEELCRRFGNFANFKEEEIYENEARYQDAEFSSRNLVPAHRTHWSTKEGSARAKDDVVCPSNWKWTEPWTIDLAPGKVDADGWEYGVYWHCPEWQNSRTDATFVRRRRWKRTRRVREDETALIHESDPTIRSGILEKEGFWNKAMKPRWFVLKKGMLFYFRSREYSHPQGMVSLIGSQILTNVPAHHPACDRADRNTFIIRSGVRDWVLRTNSLTEKEEWISALQANTINARSSKNS